MAEDDGKATQHYFSKAPVKGGRKYALRLEIRGQRIELSSFSGLFSKKRVDLGTEVLIESIILPDAGEALDMGCGCGIIGIAVAKTRRRLKVTMVDVNPMAVKLAQDNLEDNCVSNAVALESDLYSALEGKTYDVIFSNPPLAAGYKVIFPLIEGAAEHLNEGGSLQIVLRKGVNAIPKKMEEVFGNVELIARRSGYKVFRSIKGSSPASPKSSAEKHKAK
jgi:16S rRNA (guanine1207-N2)-methyltransferase